MKQLIVILSVLFFSFSCACNQEGAKERIRKAITSQLENYPKSTLRDLYKNFFQDRFGPGHIISDTTSAGRYLDEELRAYEHLHGAYYEPTGFNGNFYRVNLSVIKQNIVSRTDYFSAFVRSINGIEPMPIAKWKKEWAMIDSVIYAMNLNLDNYESDRKEIAALLQQGKYVMHHSRQFEAAYDPHYRIIEKSIFEKEILPKISVFSSSD